MTISKVKVDQLAKATKDLCLKEPFYGLFLMMLNKKWSTEVPTAGVGKLGINYQLYLNEDFWNELNPKQHISLLKHEVLHIAFFHIRDFDHLKNKEIANIAADLEVNQYINKEELPPGPQLLNLYPELNLEPKKGTKYYYDKLMKGKENPGTCPNLDKMLDAIKEEKSSVQININGERNIEVKLLDHKTWEEFKNLDEATKKLIKHQTENILLEVSNQITKSQGTIPREIVEILERITIIEPPKFNWRGYLRRFIGGSTKTFTKMSRSKPNFRFIDNPGLKHKTQRKILVAVDTSESVDTSELQEFLGEMNHIYKTGTEVIIAQCDTAIKKIGKFNPKEDFKITGRGGTSFFAVTDYYNQNFKKYNCLIYLTDGEASAPDKCKGPVLWVHSSKSEINENLKGLKIKLN